MLKINRTAITIAVLLGTFGCSSSSDKLIGSNHVVDKTTAAMVIESVGIYIPFKGVVHNGEARKIVLRGEDNLLAKISVHETAASQWKIEAAYDFPFEQHSDIQIEIPFIDMVRIAYDSDLKFADQPFEVVRKGGTAADAGSN